jgi:DNA repair protein RadC
MKTTFQNLSENTPILFRCCKDKKIHKAIIQSIVDKKRGKTIYAVIKQDKSGTAFLHIPSDSITKVLKNKGLSGPYVPQAVACKVLDTIVPDSMDYEIHSAVSRIKMEVGGSINEFVKEKLKYTDAELCKSLAAEQIDAVAMALYNIIYRKQGVIIGDQTGIGKGRIAAAIIRYGALHGLKPIFLTEKPNLFSDIYRDLKAIGSGHLVPFIVNGKESKTDILDSDEKVIYSAPEKGEQEAIFEKKRLPTIYQWVCATYSQFNSISSKPKKPAFLSEIAEDNIIIMDESHNASGTSNTGLFLQSVLAKSKGVVFLSATFAKRPDNMPIYAQKTAMSEARLGNEDLIFAINNGGVALQEILSSQLVAEGQMIRRERSMAGVEVNWITLDDKELEHRAVSDNITKIMREIVVFQNRHIDPMIKQMDKIVKADGVQLEKRKGNEAMGVDNQDLFSKAFNLTSQLLFSIKAESVADRAIQRLREGKKIVIAFANTMGSFLETFVEENGITVNDGQLVNTNYSLTLRKALDGTMRYSIRLANGKSEYKSINLNDLDEDGQESYLAIAEKIRTVSSGMTISPIDLIVQKIEDAGFSCAEVTGRKLEVRFKGSKTVGVIQSRQKVKTNTAFGRFNDNKIDCLLINQSGSTGASAHAIPTDKVPADEVRQRCMIILQPELNINTEVQKRGRINRTGQILKPIYDYVVSAIPAESRLMMMLQKKLKSLDANTTSNQKQNTKIIDFPDFLNKYGDKLVKDYMAEQFVEDELWGIIADKLTKGSFDIEAIETENLAHRVSGYVALMNTALQEKFYKEVSERYADYVEYLKQTGEYDLEVETMNLEAKTLSQEPAMLGNGGSSVFGGNVYLEKCEVNVLKKPFSEEEINNLVSQALDGMQPKAQQQQIIAEYHNFIEQKKEKAIAEIQERFEQKVRDVERNPIYKKILKDTGNAVQARKDATEELTESKNEALAKEEKTAVNQFAFLNRFFSFFYVTRSVAFQNDFGPEFPPEYALSLGFLIDKKKPNPYAPSAIRIRFAFPGSKKYIAIPLTKEFLEKVNACIGMSYNIPERSQNYVLSNWETLAKNGSVNRNIRYIITGNMLKAASKYKGKMISYTTLDKEVKKGILMPENWVKKDSKNDGKILAPIGKALKVIKSLSDGSSIHTDGGVSIMRTYKNYRIATGISRQKYGDFFLDPGILNLVDRNLFEKVSDRMVANLELEKIEQLVEILDFRFGQNVELSMGQYELISDLIQSPQIEKTLSPLIDKFTQAILFRVKEGQLNGLDGHKLKKYPILTERVLGGSNTSVEIERIPELKVRLTKGKKIADLNKILDTTIAAAVARTVIGKNIGLVEEVIVIYVNRSNKPIGYYKHTIGGRYSSIVDIPLILSIGIKSLSTGMMLIHNHPSGTLTPSDNDRSVARNLKDACKTLGLSLLDSLIVTKTDYYSFLEHKLI